MKSFQNLEGNFFKEVFFLMVIIKIHLYVSLFITSIMHNLQKAGSLHVLQAGLL